MRAEVCVVEEAYLDLLHQVFCRRRPQQTLAERVLQCLPQPFDQRDRALLPDCPEPLLYPKVLEGQAEHRAREAGSSIRDEMLHLRNFPSPGRSTARAAMASRRMWPGRIGDAA